MEYHWFLELVRFLVYCWKLFILKFCNHYFSNWYKLQPIEYFCSLHPFLAGEDFLFPHNLVAVCLLIRRLCFLEKVIQTLVRKLRIYKLESNIDDCPHFITKQYTKIKAHKYFLYFFLLEANTFCYPNVHQRQTCGNQLRQQYEKLVGWDQLVHLSHCQCILAETIIYFLQ